MEATRNAVVIALTATGLFAISIGGSSWKLRHSGKQFVPVRWATDASGLSLETISVAALVMGLLLIMGGDEMCRRADKRAEAAAPGFSLPRSFGFAIFPAAGVGFLGWAFLNAYWLT
ncbi:MAG: hypothetical protein M3505_11850 [Verrucomicrobiota bacterium]|nr:hypothetical protein [Verrucomicrobiota bacterium]